MNIRSDPGVRAAGPHIQCSWCQKKGHMAR